MIKKVAISEGSLQSTHRRWHLERGVTNPNCKYCREDTTDATEDEGLL